MSTNHKESSPHRIWAIGPAHPDNVTSAGIMLQRIYSHNPGMDLQFVFVTDDALIDVKEAKGGSRFRSAFRILAAPFSHFYAILQQEKRAVIVANRILSRGGADIIIGVTGAVSSLPLASSVAKRLKVPVIMHIFDNPVYQWMNPFSRMIARKTVGPVLGDANAICCSNEIMADGIRDLAEGDIGEVFMLRNPVPDEVMFEPELASQKVEGDELVLVYTGSVYDAQLGALKAFVEAIALLRERGVGIRMDIYSRMPRDRWYLLGHPAPGIAIFDVVDNDVALHAQRAADLLALPLSFQSRYPKLLINSSAPGKFAEYLASGTPIVVHAPKNSFPSVYCRKMDCAIVVDEPSVEILADRILEATVSPRSAELATRSRQLARDEFAQSKVSKRAAELIRMLIR